MGSIRCKLCGRLLGSSPVLRAGDLLLEDRGLLDGATIKDLQTRRKVSVIVPLRSDMLFYAEAVKLAQMAGHWEPHPTRRDQQIAFVRGVEQVWDECDVEFNASVIRFFNKKKKALDYIVLVTTDLSLNAAWIVRHYEERPKKDENLPITNAYYQRRRNERAQPGTLRDPPHQVAILC